MTFIHLTLILIIFLLIFPAKIKEPNNIKFYDEYSLRLIANKLEELNKSWNEQLDEYFQTQND